MKRFLLSVILALPVWAQLPQIAVPNGQLTAAGTACGPTNCVTAVLEGNNYGSVGFQLAGTWSATVIFEGTADGVNWATLPMSNPIATANGLYFSGASGLFAVRARCSAFSSGTIQTTVRPGIDTLSFGLYGTTASSLTGAFNQGAEISEHGPRWTVVSNPAVSTQATASKAAGGAGVRHVADCVTFSGGSTTAPALTQLMVNLRDGATGAGSVLWNSTTIVTAAVGQNVLPFTACGLGLIGSANTAMTLEFSALLTNLFENVVLTGYDVQ